MKSRTWDHFVPNKSRVVPDAFFGCAHPYFNRLEPNKTFTGVTYAIDVSGSSPDHTGWDHFLGIYYKRDFQGEIKFTETKALVKRNIAPGRYQFLFHFYHFFEPISESDFEATLFNHPDENDIYFYIRPYLINPDDRRIFYLWDRDTAEVGSKGFPIGDPSLLTGLKPFIKD